MLFHAPQTRNVALGACRCGDSGGALLRCLYFNGKDRKHAKSAVTT